MELYFAPMEGMTGFPYRNAHAEVFGQIDGYYTPFVAVGENYKMRKREMRDLDPANNKVQTLVPQFLTNHAGALITAGEDMEKRGYKEYNLNLGCPSGTVTAKGKGAGFLREKEALDRFFEAVFEGMDQKGLRIKLSVKTRLGVENPWEMQELIEIYNRYPISELIIHARTLKQRYMGDADQETFGKALAESVHPVCYNGNIFTAEDYQKFCRKFPVKDFPKLKGVMMGRGLIQNPALAREIRGGVSATGEELWHFFQVIMGNYRREMQENNNLLCKAKDIWSLMGQQFADDEKMQKKMRKTKSMAEFESYVHTLLLGR